MILLLIDVYFLLGGVRGGVGISEALLECSCLHIDYLSSLRALSLTFEKANNRKPAFIFSFVRSWAFSHLVNGTKGYISYHLYFWTGTRTIRGRKFTTVLKQMPSGITAPWEHIPRQRFLWRSGIQHWNEHVVGKIKGFCYWGYCDYLRF